VAASVASVFGLKLAALGAEGEIAAEAFEKAELLAPVTFLVILGTVTICGLGAGPLARYLGLADPNPQGVLLAGASGWVREIALALQRLELRVLLVDTNYANVTAARMMGLDAKCGNILSEYVQEEQDLAGIGNFLAVTPSDELNTLAAMEYVHVFSRANVFQLASKSGSHARFHSLPETRRGRPLFGPEFDYARLEALFERGATLKTTAITDSFSFREFRQTHGNDAIVLFCVDPDRKLKISTKQSELEPQAGDTVIAIVPAVEAATDTDESEESSPRFD
jgi:hypothetical protein